MKTRTTILLFSLLSFLSLNAQTSIQGGDVYGDWFLTGSPYLIEGDIHLPSDQRLRIYPGVQVIFLGEYGFEVEGKLEATGTVSDSITFTAFDTTGYSQGNFSGWNGIYFNGLNYSFADSTKLAYCNIQFSQYSGIICSAYPEFSIIHSSVKYNHSSGIVLYEASNIRAESIIISNNNAGGMVSWSSAPQVSNFIIEKNGGSGISINGNCAGNMNAFFKDGKIQNNSSSNTGGGIKINTDAVAMFTNVEIIENSAAKGGGVYCGIADCGFTNVTLRGNHALKGGGVFGDNFSSITFNFSTIVKNHADLTGGGAYMNQGELALNNCTVSVNSAGTNAGGVYYNIYSGSAGTIVNSILWNNIPDEIVATVVAPLVSFSDILGGFNGINNIDADPLFVDPLNDDFTLTWSGFPEENTTKSPCIDAGDPDSNYDPDGTNSDLGAWYYNQDVFTTIYKSNINHDINVYPNPAQNYINIKGSVSFDRVIILSLTGAIVDDQPLNNAGFQLNVSGYQPGIYIVQVYDTQDLVATRKVIIE